MDVQNVGEVAWRLLANLDPKRDMSFVEGPIDQLDHGANQALYGGKMAIDGTKKWPEEGYRREWPEVARMKPEVDARVDGRWAELGIDARWQHGKAAGTRPSAASGGAASPPDFTASLLNAARALLQRPQ